MGVEVMMMMMRETEEKKGRYRGGAHSEADVRGNLAGRRMVGCCNIFVHICEGIERDKRVRVVVDCWVRLLLMDDEKAKKGEGSKGGLDTHYTVEFDKKEG